MNAKQRLWPDDLEMGDTLEIDGFTYEVVGTGPSEATLERLDDETVEAKIFRWAFTDSVGIELTRTLSQEEFERSIDTQTEDIRTDGGTLGRERTLNPETHTASDYLRLIYEADAAIHFYLKDDKEWWVAHGPENVPPGTLNGPWLLFTHYPSGGWELNYCTEELITNHLEELYYVDYDGDEMHSIHRARIVPIEDAMRFVQEVVGSD